ncbi:hypothetical protein ZTR_09891 [Talaromyces verruculosus]|nr:hypothetical protein ZTR_09891 [Talaromyces verruculosus]
MINSFRIPGIDWITPPQELPVVIFCQAVLFDPSLSGFTSSLRLFNARPPARVTKPYRPFRVSLYAKTVGSASHSKAARLRWMDGLKRGDEDAWLALLLVLLTNLQTLDIVLAQPEMWPHVSRVLRDTALQNTPLQYLTSLHEVHLRPISLRFQNAESLPLSRLLHYMRIPAVGCIQAARVCADNIAEIRGRSHVSSIRLTSSRLLLPCLSPIIERCYQLKDFRCSSAHRTLILERLVPLMTRDIFDPAPLYKALCKHRTSLQVLSLTFEDDIARYLWQTPDFPTRHYLGDLSIFPVLESLQIRLANLLDFYSNSWEPSTELLRVLPPSLRCLHIVDCHTDALSYLLPSLSEIADKYHHLFPNLRNLVICPPGHEGPPEHEDFWSRWYEPKLYPSAPTPERHASLHASLSGLADRFREVGVEFLVLDRSSRVGFL